MSKLSKDVRLLAQHLWKPESVSSLWIGSELSVIQQLSIRSFLANGHPFHLYVYGDVAGIPAGTQVHDANAILPERDIFYYAAEGFGKGSPAVFANLFRYKMLYENGGWWVDTDMVCLRPFLFDTPYVLGAEREADGTRVVNNAVIRAPKHSPLMERCLAAAMAADRKTIKWGETGPLLLDRMVRELCLGAVTLPPEVFYPIDYWQFSHFFDGHQLPPSTFAVHLWGAIWKESGTRPDSDFDPSCVIGRLKERYLSAEPAI